MCFLLLLLSWKTRKAENLRILEVTSEHPGSIKPQPDLMRDALPWLAHTLSRSHAHIAAAQTGWKWALPRKTNTSFFEKKTNNNQLLKRKKKLLSWNDGTMRQVFSCWPLCNSKSPPGARLAGVVQFRSTTFLFRRPIRVSWRCLGPAQTPGVMPHALAAVALVLALWNQLDLSEDSFTQFGLYAFSTALVGLSHRQEPHAAHFIHSVNKMSCHSAASLRLCIHNYVFHFFICCVAVCALVPIHINKLDLLA